MSINPAWTKGLDPKDKAEVEQILKNSQKSLDIFQKMVYNVYIDSHTNRREDYELPAWPYFQADRLGQQKALEQILSLLSSAMGDQPYQQKRKALTDVGRKQLRT